ncbi:MAG: sigma 54-interacting transcriptional regulator [Deltaproteobacteria bacterium]|nr:sigma 54-interacting transcriptional regulator [Deltaproteobacteria bacterium]
MDDEEQTGRHRLPEAGQWMRLLQRHQSEHPALLRVLDVFERLQQRQFRTHVVLYGEQGTGKEGLARALHALMYEYGAPFVSCSLAGLTPSARAAELCGEGDTPGLIERADGGTLYVDQAEPIAPELQSRLLAATRGRVRREGEIEERTVRVTVTLTSERSLADEVQSGRFRHDLYWRLARIELSLPPLRERRADIGRLALWIGSRILQSALRDGRLVAHDELSGPGDVVLESDAIEALEQHDWPGNLRQLDAVLERALLLYRRASSEPLSARHIAQALAGPSDALDPSL